MTSDGNARYAEARRRAQRTQTRQRDQQATGVAAGGPGDTPWPGRPCSCGGADPLTHSGYWHYLAAAATATKQEWVAYAPSLGLTPAEATRMTRAQLAARFPGRGWRTYCTVSTAAGRCPCESYAPATTPGEVQ